jgi:hypothetical protein
MSSQNFIVLRFMTQTYSEIRSEQELHASIARYEPVTKPSQFTTSQCPVGPLSRPDRVRKGARQAWPKLLSCALAEMQS